MDPRSVGGVIPCGRLPSTAGLGGVGQRLDPLAAGRADLERYVRWMQEARYFEPSAVLAVRSTGPPPDAAAYTRTCSGMFFVTTMLDAGVDLRDVQIAARHADPRTTMRYDRARQNLDRHPNDILAAYMSSGTRPQTRSCRIECVWTRRHLGVRAVDTKDRVD